MAVKRRLKRWPGHRGSYPETTFNNIGYWDELVAQKTRTATAAYGDQAVLLPFLLVVQRVAEATTASNLAENEEPRRELADNRFWKIDPRAACRSSQRSWSLLRP